jgi:hypothetical protein
MIKSITIPTIDPLEPTAIETIPKSIPSPLRITATSQAHRLPVHRPKATTNESSPKITNAPPSPAKTGEAPDIVPRRARAAPPKSRARPPMISNMASIVIPVGLGPLAGGTVPYGGSELYGGGDEADIGCELEMGEIVAPQLEQNCAVGSVIFVPQLGHASKLNR